MSRYGPKYLRYAIAQGSKLYIALVDAALERLTTSGVFSFVQVLQDAGYDALPGDSVRWDYIKRMIDEDQAQELIPLASSFFTRLRKEDREPGIDQRLPGRFIAHGQGKTTAGYALATPQNDHFVIYVLDRKRNRAFGIAKAHDRFLEVADNHGSQNADQPMIGKGGRKMKVIR